MLSSFMLFFLPLTFSCTHLRTVRTGSYASGNITNPEDFPLSMNFLVQEHIAKCI